MRARTHQGFRSVLCPVDFSPHALAALRVAGAVAARTGAPLTVLYASDPLLEAAAAAATHDRAQRAAQSRRELSRFVARASLTVTPALMLASGPAAAVIQRAATRTAADLLVMGTHGLSGARKWLLGSTTEQVLRKSRVPVLVVPPRVGRADAARAFPGARVIVAVDLADDARPDARTLRRVLTVLGAAPRYVHVLRPVALPSWFGPAGDHAVRETDAQAVLARVEREVGVDAATEIVTGDPAEALAAAAARARADLIILTLHRGTGLLGARQGTMTYRVVARGSTAVLALPPGERRRARA